MNRTLSFGERNFGEVDLGDRRRTKRLVELADGMHQHPGGTLPEKLRQPADLRALYRLMDRPEVTHETVMAGHKAETRRRIAESGETVLLLHDATELDYTSKTTLRDQLGQIGMGTQVGYICHNSLAVQADTGETLALTSQILHQRANVAKKETPKQKRERQNRESRLWVRGAAASGAAPEGILCVDVSDSLSDTYEYMSYEAAQGRHFVLRGKENRKLCEPLFGQDYLLDGMRQAPASGEDEVDIAGTTARKPRTAKVKISFTPVRLAPPARRSGDYENKPLDMWAVRVWEPKPPKGEQPLEWVLLTNVPVIELAAAQARIAWYRKRWIIEEYHKGMKTGCGIEAMQFTHIDRMEPAIALVSAVTTMLLCLRDAARADDADSRKATEVIAPEYVDVLSAHYSKRLSSDPSVKEFYMHVARLGGHQNRKCDGFPGWLTLWRGWMTLQAMVDGYTALRRKTPKQCGNT